MLAAAGMRLWGGLRNASLQVSKGLANGKLQRFFERFHRSLALMLGCLFLTCSPQRIQWSLRPQPFPTTGHWYRGNLHTHTTETDGKLDPATVVQRYESEGYDFLFLTDHNRVIDLPPSRHMLVFPGEEVTLKHEHINGLNLHRTIPRKVAGTAAGAVKKILVQGGIPIVNHPAYPRPLSADFVRSLGARHVEVINGTCSNDGFRVELHLWDELLSSGYFCLAVGSDDSHEPEHIGREGRLLADVHSELAHYTLTGREGYVRVEVIDAQGRRAWTQPLHYAL